MAEEVLKEFQLPGDLKFVFNALRARGLDPYLVGPAVRDLISEQGVSRTSRFDILVLTGDLRRIEEALSPATGDQLFVPGVQRLRRGLAAEVRDRKGETVRRLVLNTPERGNNLREELVTREVTLNAMAVDCRGVLIDPFNGAEDLQENRLQPIREVNQIFRERPLNILKMAKHAAFHQLYPGRDVVDAARRESERLLDIPPAGWRPDFERMLLNRSPDLGLRFLNEAGALRFLLPELELLVGFENTCNVHHKDVWQHTIAVVRQAKPSPGVRWAALLHDIGKYWTRSVSHDGQVHFFRHEDMSAHLCRGILPRFGLDEKLSERIIFLVQNHSRITLYSEDWTESAVRRLIKETEPFLEDLIALARADITSKREGRVEEIKRMTSELESRIEEVRVKDSYVPPLPTGIGTDIIAHFHLEPGPVVGTLKKVLEAAVEDGRLARGQTTGEYLAFLADYIASSRT